jgi:hypothetical protein
VRLFKQVSITFNEWQKCCISIRKTSKLLMEREITTVYHKPQNILAGHNAASEC